MTLFSNGSKEVFPENTLTAFTIQLAQSVDLGLSDWEVGLAELSYKAPHPKLFKGKCVDVHSSESALVYCNLIAPQMVGTERVRVLRTVHCPVQSGYHMFENILYVQVEKTLFQDIRIELWDTRGEPAALVDGTVPTKVVLHFRRV